MHGMRRVVAVTPDVWLGLVLQWRGGSSISTPRSQFDFVVASLDQSLKNFCTGISNLTDPMDQCNCKAGVRLACVFILYYCYYWCFNLLFICIQHA